MLNSTKKYTNWDNVPIVLDINTVALIFGVNISTIKRWLYSNQIRGTKQGKQWIFDKEYIKGIVSKGICDE